LQFEEMLDVPTRQGSLAIRASEIEHVKAAGNYVELVTGTRTLLLRTTLQVLSEQLGPVGFVRVHRSLLVNALHVLATRRGARGRRLVRLHSGTELPIGRQFSDELDTLLTTPPP
jgi:DNA-binding LytR/AlgR family response regulator